MCNFTASDSGLIHRARLGETDAVAELFNKYRTRLYRLIELRLDPRLAGRVDPSDVLQDAYIDVHNRIAEFFEGDLPIYLWLRFKVGHRLTDVHRFHLRAQKRCVAREISLFRGAMPPASSASLASQLLGRITSASNAAIREEMRLRVQDALNALGDIDREVLVLRHFEDLTNSETATILDISERAASNRYVRALQRMKSAMQISAA